MAFISSGTTIIDNGAFQVSLGSKVLISEQTASASATVSFTTGIDSTYPIYEFEFIDIHAGTDTASFTFNMSTDSGSNYNVTKTSTYFNAAHNEANTDAFLEYTTGLDLALSTAFQAISNASGSDADQSFGGSMSLFNPSSTTYVKHFLANTSDYTFNDYNRNSFIAGYGNTTSAVNAIQFKFNSGNIDSGKIKLYGIKDS